MIWQPLNIHPKYLLDIPSPSGFSITWSSQTGNCITGQCPRCSWGSSSPSGSLEPGGHSWALAPRPALSGRAVLAPPAPSLYTDQNRHEPPEPADPAGFWDQVLAAFASTLWNGVWALLGIPSAEWRWGAGAWTPGRCQHHAATPRHRCTSP